MAQEKRNQVSKLKIFKTKLPYIIFSHVIIFITGFIKIPIYSSIFSPGELGNYSLVLSSLNYIDIILLSWISSTFWRFIYETNPINLKHQLFSSFAPLLIILSSAGFSIAFILGSFIINFDGSLVLFLLGFLSILLQQITAIFFMVLQSENEIKKWSIVLAAQSIFSLLLFFIFLFFFKANLLIIFLSSIGINIILLIAFYQVYPNIFTSVLSFWKQQNNFNKIFFYSFQSTFVNVLLVVLINADRFIISAYKGKSETGIYSQIYSVAYVGLSFVIQGFTNILLPFFNKATINNLRQKDASNIIKLYLLTFTPACIFLILNSKLIIQLVLSKAYHSNFAIFSWVVAGIYLYGLANFFEIRLKLLNRINIVAYVLILVTALNVLSNFYVLKDHGIEWAARITFVSYAVLLISVLMLNYKNLKRLSLKYELYWLFLSSIALVFFTLLIKYNFPGLPDLVFILFSSVLLLIIYLLLYKLMQPVFLSCYQLLKN